MTKLVTLAALTALVAAAQSGNSSISGSIKDPADAAIAGATVKVTNLETGVHQETATNEVGLYRVAALVPGSYRVEVDAVGFDHLSRGPLNVQVSQSLALDLTVQLGQQSALVTVNEAAPLVESQTSSTSQTVNRQ